MYHLGIDVSKAKLDCCLKLGNRYLHRVFKNNREGYEKLKQWLDKYAVGSIHACLEATGIYGEAVAEYLHDAGCLVSVVNPLVIKKYIEMQLLAVKTDKQDCRSIADYCAEQKPRLYKFPSQSERELKALTRQLQYLTEMQTAQRNRLQVVHEVARQYVQATLVHIEQQIKAVEIAIREHISQDDALQHKAKLLQSVRGIGKRTIPHLLTLFAERDFMNAKQVVSYIGLNPILKQSGSQKTRYCSISKQGNKFVRTALYMPAVVCFRLPEFQDFIQRLQKSGKKKMQIVCALMRKLLVYCFTTLKNNQPFVIQHHCAV